MITRKMLLNSLHPRKKTERSGVKKSKNKGYNMRLILGSSAVDNN
jgi:hypothetical protein